MENFIFVPWYIPFGELTNNPDLYSQTSSKQLRFPRGIDDFYIAITNLAGFCIAHLVWQCKILVMLNSFDIQKFMPKKFYE